MVGGGAAFQPQLDQLLGQCTAVDSRTRSGAPEMVHVALPAAGQVGHPAKGSWTGYYGPNNSEQHRFRLLLDWEDRRIVGEINPGRRAISLDRIELDYSSWTMTLEADLPVDGGTARFIVTGKIENLGSWTNRLYSGSYTLGSESGEFWLSLN